MLEKEIIEKLVDMFVVNESGNLHYFYRNTRTVEEIYGKDFEKTLGKYLTGKRKEVFNDLNNEYKNY